MENQKLEIEEKLDVFINGKDMRTLKDGKYIDEVTMLYEDLLCMAVNTNNVERVFHKVLNQLGEIKVGRLPKSTFAKCMAVEARALAQLNTSS